MPIDPDEAFATSDELERRFKITCGGVLKNQLGDKYQWGARNDGKAL